ncbi:MAG TPA: Fe-Mn family superoxide dismutase [Alphaproteobacteria bacterium]|nr:Fe-Mn family superoxide dismutase [Alphaproteobacteria bacterium]
MRQKIAPIPFRPWMLSGLSERMVVSHYENDYGGAVRALNALRGELQALSGAGASSALIRSLKREELSAMDSIALHELYFSTLGGEGRMTAGAAARLEADFGSVEAWRDEFIAMAQALRGGLGWAQLSYSHRDRRLYNHAGGETQAIVDATPILVLDMYEHAYHMDFGANLTAYVDAFMRNVDWKVIEKRLERAEARAPLPEGEAAESSVPVSVDEITAAYDAAAIARLGLPSVSVEELFDALAEDEKAQVVDARPRHYFSRNVDMMRAAVWRDPNRIDQWAKELSPDKPVFVYCAYGYHVGCSVTAALRQRGFDARFLRGGLSAWYAAGGERVLKTPDPNAIAV